MSFQLIFLTFYFVCAFLVNGIIYQTAIKCKLFATNFYRIELRDSTLSVTVKNVTLGNNKAECNENAFTKLLTRCRFNMMPLLLFFNKYVCVADESLKFGYDSVASGLSVHLEEYGGIGCDEKV